MAKAIRNADGTVVLKVLTNLDDFGGAMKLRDDLDALCSDGESRIVLDMANVNRLNGYGIGKILLYYKKLRDRGGELFLGPMNESVKETIDSLMLTELINQHR